MALVLIGEGRRGTASARRTGAEALRPPAWPGRAGAEGRPRAHQRHAGLDGRARLALAGAERLARAADVAPRSRSTRCSGSRRPFDPRIHAARPFAGQAASADNLDRLIAGSGINASHANCGRVQDAYSMRCAPQVHGAAREALRGSVRS
jgi:histidine ammonia-lyase